MRSLNKKMTRGGGDSRRTQEQVTRGGVPHGGASSGSSVGVEFPRRETEAAAQKGPTGAPSGKGPENLSFKRSQCTGACWPADEGRQGRLGVAAVESEVEAEAALVVCDPVVLEAV
ncbi:hypothetical protein E2C01_051267 [Portunus trituberculatus]|uniref:Uncharacterized protein n=1 Tax=Portunus trituberculatus TaxID=210409 RepID=A0A5B7GAI8_PORTR|nr:hypothetical protein [Portunus trituberculatus]